MIVMSAAGMIRARPGGLGAALRCVRAQTLTGGAPLRAGGAPVRAGGAPLRAGGAPVRGEGAPVRGEGAPVRAGGTPVRGEGGPVRAGGTPVRGEGAPVRGEGAPFRAGGAPVRGEGAPVRGEGAPVRAGGAPVPLCCFRLSSRALLHLQGPDTGSFLQGIITNDMKLLEEDGEALYAHMLNVQGRTMYDLLIYSLKGGSEEPGGLLLECEGSVLDSMTRHLKVYKIRRKVSVNTRPDLSLWALLPRDPPCAPAPPLPLPPPLPSAPGRPLVLVQDPRTMLMGWRMITRSTENPPELLATCELRDTEQYHRHRYAIGLPEGVADLPPGEALPLESNLAFMNGISFSKGCYIGQELTARTHHIGVVRKRLMPVRLSVPAEGLQPGGALESAGGKPAGKLRAGLGELGLGLIRLAHAKDTLTLKTSTHTSATAHPSEPAWWPKDSK